MTNAGKILIVTALISLWQCAAKDDKIDLNKELSVIVEDSTGVPLDGADVYVFDNKTLFNQTISTGDPAGFVSSAKTINGTVVLKNLNATLQYHIYATYKDYGLFPGSFITLDNSDGNFAVVNSITPGSISTLRISLKPVDGFVTFWTANSNSAALPIDIFFGSDVAGQLPASSSSPPGPFQPGGQTIRSRMGTLALQGHSVTGCAWKGQVTITPGQNSVYQFSDCAVGTVAFYTDNSNVANFPIGLTLNHRDIVAIINAPVEVTNVDCATANLAIIRRTPGEYTYLAATITSTCLWSNTFSLDANECKIIYLSTCP